MCDSGGGDCLLIGEVNMRRFVEFAWLVQQVALCVSFKRSHEMAGR